MIADKIKKIFDHLAIAIGILIIGVLGLLFAINDFFEIIPALTSSEHIDTVILTVLSSYVIVHFSTYIHTREISGNIDEIKSMASSLEEVALVRKKKKQSVNQVNLMLNEVEERIKNNEKVIIYEAHLEPDPPTEIIEEHREIVEKGKDENFEWNIVIGQKENNKSDWIEKLKSKIKKISPDKYKIYIMDENKPSLNIVLVQSISQVYFGFGNWLKDESTGGIWIKSKHFSNSMEMVFKELIKEAKEVE